MQAAIARVTVHRNGALVVRRGRAEPGDVVVEGLPLLYSSDSLRVRATRGEVHDVFETCALSTSPKPPPRAEADLAALSAKEALLDDELARIAALVKAYENVKPGEPGRAPPERLPDAQVWIEAQALAGEKLRSLEERRASLHRAKAALARERASAQRQGAPDVDPPRFSRGVRFRLLGESAADVEIEYFVSAARWVPTYTLHLANGRGTLALAALVAQASGEDWSGAELAFSTADLAREATLPELLSWRIGREQPLRRPSFRPLPGDLAELFAGYDRDARPPMAPKGGGLTSRSAPAPPPPPSVAPVRKKSRASVRDRSEPMGAAMPAEMELDEDDGGMFEGASASFEMAKEAKMAPLAPELAPSLGRARGGGGGPGGAPMSAPIQRVPSEPLPPRLRHAYLRLQGPEDAGRGTLRAVDPTQHLWDLVEDHGSATLLDLQRAVDALKVARERVLSLSPPLGTVALPADSFQHVYRAAGVHEVPSDGSYHRVQVERREADARIDFRAVPREASDVYRFCTLQAPQGAPLLPGPLHVYEDGAFRVTSRIDGSGGGQRLELNLGVESAVRVLGRTVQVSQEEKGLVSQRSQVVHEVSLQLRSSLPTPARVLLYERLPVADENEKDIEVTLEKSEPAPVRDGKDPRGHPLEGGLHFVVEVPPGERARVVYRYLLSLPAKAEVIGGNRRE